MKFEVLRASDKIESQTWDSIIEMLPIHRRDIHFTSAYGRVQEHLGGEALLAVASHFNEDWFIAQPFIKRAVPSNPERFDLCSPYGYGGPVSNMDSVYILYAAKSFETALCEWCVSNRVVTEFCNLHPLFMLHQKKLLTSEPKLIAKDVVVIDLKDFSSATVSRRVNRGVRKARTQGAKIRLLDDDAAKATFEALYKMSIDRLHATDRWRFPTEYLGAHYDELSAMLFHANNGSGERMLMVIGGYGTAYAHFLGSNGLSLHSGLDEFLYSEAAIMLRERGYERFHLGGGTTREPFDKLLAFKSGFVKSAADRWKFATYTRVFDEPEYAELCARKLIQELAQPHGEIDLDYFPVYRRPAA